MGLASVYAAPARSQQTSSRERSRCSQALTALISDAQREEGKARVMTMSKWLQQGVPPDVVGDMVLDAVRGECLYIHTDRTMATMIEIRCKRIA